LWITALFLLAAGCAATHRVGVCSDDLLVPTQTGDLASLEAKAVNAWMGRHQEANLQEAIAQWQTATTIAPKKVANHLRLANALYLWADGPLRISNQHRRSRKAFRRATDAAERALMIGNPMFRESVCSREPFENSIQFLRNRDVPAVYAYARALGKYGLTESVIVVLEHRKRLRDLMARVRRLDPTFHFHAADRFLGAYYSKIPFPTGDLARSRAHFERAITANPTMLSTRVLMAELLAPKLGDRTLFKEQLQAVLDTPLDAIPALAPEQLIEKHKAKALLADIDSIFPSATPAPDAPPSQQGWLYEAPTWEDRSGPLPGHKLHLVRSGEQMDHERWSLVQQAQRSLYISAYAWKNDNVGLSLVDAVCRRIRETDGRLEVKILVENYGSKELKLGIAKRLRTENGLFRSGKGRIGAHDLIRCGASIVFYRPRQEDLRYLMQVRHEKLFIVDHKVLLTGGSNIGDHYHMASARSGKWYDLDIHIEGPAACWYHNQFQKSWTRVVSQDIGYRPSGVGAPRPNAPFMQAFWKKHYGLNRMVPCTVDEAPTPGHSTIYGVMGRPVSTDQRPILDTYIQSIQEAKHSIRLYAPYFVPAHAFAQALIGARKRGVKVTIITNSPESLDEDNLIFSAMLLSVFHKYDANEITPGGSLFEHGVDVRIWSRKATFHRKGGIFDAGQSATQKTFLGSDNLDVRGQEYSTESVVWTDDPSIIMAMAHGFDDDLRTTVSLTEAYRKKYLATERGHFMGRMKLWLARSARNLF
jgi:phosphatidylserine/phosphatidylglycerophosphate/cardiolipin synthase-like enzyme